MLRRVALPAVVAFAALAINGPAQAQQRSDPTFRTSTELVVIDMVAIDSRGRFIPDLRLDEVEVREDGRRQKVELLRMVGPEPGPPSPAPPGSSAEAIAPAAGGGRASAAADASRRLIIVIDSNSVAAETLPRVREALSSAIADLPTSVPVMLATIEPELVVRQLFTTDRQALSAAVAALPAQLRAAASPSAVFEAVDRVCAAAVGARRAVEVAIETGERVIIDANARSAATASALSELLTGIGTLEGRKHLVLYSAGHAVSTVNHVVDAVAAAVSGCSGVDAMTARRQASAALARLATRDAAEGLRAVIERANRAQTTFYTLDPAGISTDAVLPHSRGSSRSAAAPTITFAQLRNDAGRDYLRGLADETGGLTVQSNDIGVVLRRASEDADRYYLVGYTPSSAGSKGPFRKLSVSVKRSGVNVRYRKGYFALPRVAVEAARTPTPVSPLPCCPSRPAERKEDNAAAADALALAAGYVDQFVGRFANIVIEETMNQTLSAPAPPTSRGGLRTLSSATTTRRRLVSEFLLVRPTGTAFWIPFRDVLEVDGRPLTDRRDRLMRLFVETGGSGTEQANRIALAGAAHQLGPRTRTTTNPVIALAFLQPHHQHRFRYNIERPRRAASDLITLEFRETVTPTLMRTDDGQDLPIRGAFTIDARSGAVLESELVLKTFVESVLLRTRYTFDERLQVHIPSEMTETYLMNNGGKLESVAKYGHFRTFAVSTSEVVK